MDSPHKIQKLPPVITISVEENKKKVHLNMVEASKWKGES